MLKFLIKGVLRDRHRFLFPILIVCSGVFLMVFALAFMDGFMQSFVRQNAAFETGHLKVVTRSYSEIIEQKPYDLGFIDIGQDLEAWKKEYPDLEWVSRIYFGALLDVPDSRGESREQGDVVGIAVDLSPQSVERSLLKLDKSIVSGRLPTQPQELLLSGKALEKLRLKLGDPVTLISSDIYGSMVFMQFTVCGTVNFGVQSLDRGAVIANIEDVRSMLDMPDGASEILAFLPGMAYDRRTAYEIKDSFNRRYSKPDDDFAPVMLAMSDQNDLGYILGMMDNVLAIVSLVFIFIMGIVLWNSGLLNGIRRYGEIGVRLAVGESKFHIFFSQILESLTIGVLGSVVGILLGLAISWYFNRNGLDISVFGRNSNLMTENVIHTSITVKTALSGFIPGIFSTVLGAALAGIAVFKRQTSQLFKELET